MDQQTLERLANFEEQIANTIANSSALIRLAVVKGTITSIMLNLAASKLALMLAAEPDLAETLALYSSFHQIQAQDAHKDIFGG